jgi:formylglycine-generating enzyme required for sulfatase activity
MIKRIIDNFSVGASQKILGVVIVITFALLIWQFLDNDDIKDITVNTMNEGYGEYLLVPAGRFSMGDNYDEGNPRERPVHTVYLDSYYIGEYEVTNEEYNKFIQDGSYEKEEYWSRGGFGMFTEPLYWNDSALNGGGLHGNEKFPVVGVSWFEARARYWQGP